MRLLLVEDDPMIGESLREALRRQGFAADWVRDGLAADGVLASGEHFDAVLLDLGLPRRSGVDVLRTLRARGDATPVIVLTARDALADKVAGLDAGADDYLVKPFALTELVARARALVRRSQARTSNQLQLARLRIDQEARRAYIDEEPLALSAREWDVLGFLMARAGKVVPKEHIALASNAWDQGVSDNAIEVCLSRLRAKIEPGGVQLRTVRGLGYLLEEIG